jgi:hypothetical protein
MSSPAKLHEAEKVAPMNPYQKVDGTVGDYQNMVVRSRDELEFVNKQCQIQSGISSFSVIYNFFIVISDARFRPSARTFRV